MFKQEPSKDTTSLPSGGWNFIHRYRSVGKITLTEELLQDASNLNDRPVC